MRLTNFLLLFVFFHYNSFCQKKALDKVTKQELELKRHPLDSSASAAILFKKMNTKFVFNYNDGYSSLTEVEVKIKVFKKEGLQWANFSIPYYVGYKNLGKEVVSIEKANTYNLLDNKIVKEKVSSASIIKENVNDFWSRKKVFFPNVREGSIIELKYVFATQNLSELPDFQFQYGIPVDYAEYFSEIPEFYIYKIIKNGFINVELDEKIINSSTRFNDKHNETGGFLHKSIVDKIIVNNVPALLSEDYVINVDNYLGKIEFELQTIRMPEEEVKHISKTWNDVAVSVYKEKMFGDELKKYEYFLSDLKYLIKTENSETEKLFKIFSFLQNRMNWNNRYNFLPTDSLENIYKEKVGTSGEINLILVAMLRMAGLKADPVLTSTRDNGLALFPNRSKLNSVLVNVKLNDNSNFLCDASSKFTFPNLIDLNHDNEMGQLINIEGSAQEIKIMPAHNSKKIITVGFNLDQQDRIKGKMRIAHFGYNALNFREKYSKIATDSYLQIKEKEINDALISNYSVENDNDFTKPVVENFDFESDNFIDRVGDKIYINPLLNFGISVNPFISKERKHPVDFPYTNNDKISMFFDIPKDYIVESLPKPLQLIINDKTLSYSFNISSDNKQIKIVSQLEINAKSISPEIYEELKAFFSEVVKKQTEKIVLKKV